MRIVVALDELLAVKTAMRSLSLYIDDVASGRKLHYIITRRSQPRAALVSIERYEELLELEREQLPLEPLTEQRKLLMVDAAVESVLPVLDLLGIEADDYEARRTIATGLAAAVLNGAGVS